MKEFNELDHYSQLLSKFSASDARALGWHSKETQELRFKVLHEIGITWRDSVLDVGCGVGDYLRYADTKGRGDYTGIDKNVDMIGAAIQKQQCSVDKTFACATIDKMRLQYDYVIASGIFTFVTSHFQLFDTVEKMYARCNKGVAFNSLSAWSAKMQGGEFYADPAYVLEACSELARFVTLRHDYHAGDFTIYMYRERKL